MMPVVFDATSAGGSFKLERVIWAVIGPATCNLNVGMRTVAPCFEKGHTSERTDRVEHGPGLRQKWRKKSALLLFVDGSIELWGRAKIPPTHSAQKAMPNRHAGSSKKKEAREEIFPSQFLTDHGRCDLHVVSF